MSIKENLRLILSEIPTDKVTLVAVSKTHPAEKIQDAYNSGQRDFGENKVQELRNKQPLLPADIRWHLIGHLQSNKVKYIIPFVHLIHSIDSEKLLAEVDKQSAKAGKITKCLLQIHIAMEENKFGFSEEEIIEFFRLGSLSRYPNVQVKGLMGMATYTDNESQVRNEFKKLKSLFELLKNKYDSGLDTLSMGMSGDYKIAIEEGSTMIRVGSAIFGERDYSVV